MSELLEKYRSMRTFRETPEPAGGTPKPGKQPIFVIQKHHASQLHYDFRLEMEGVLKSWAVPRGPSYDPAAKRLAMMTEDHPYDYAAFEGVIPEGNYGAGNVIIWDQGTWEFVEPGDDPVKALKQGKLAFKLFGRKMFGEWALVRIKGRSAKGNEWLLLKHKDEWANAEVDVTEVAPQSVVSGLDVDEVGSENVWISNRKAASRRAPSRSARGSAGAAAAETPAARSPKPVTTKTKTRPGNEVPASRSRVVRPEGASARSQSSPAPRPRKAGTTARRRPR
jgi:bifunctional non-homologous end joining protein LigD